MATIKLPPTLTVEEDEEFDPADRYGEPIKKIITVKFGEHEVARFELLADHWPGNFYFDSADDPNRRMLYDTPEEFLAHKLKKLFKLLD